MRVTKLNLKNIGPFENTEIEFRPSGGMQEIHIFTGPNGSGKTTLLQSLSIFFGSSRSDIEALLKKMRGGDSSKIEVIVKDQTLKIDMPFGLDRQKLVYALEPQRAFGFGIPDPAYKGYEIPYLPQIASRNEKEEWVSFAYTGYRTVRSIPINAIQEVEYESWSAALNEAMTFDKQSLENRKSFTLNQWIANSISKRALSKEKGKDKEAKKFAVAINILEKIIAKIVGYEIEFDLKTTPLSLVIKAHNSELEFDVLPDGLRATISWVGDLLMRLDSFDALRLDSPDWDQTLPINERRIFLFLDEIDVHLHPAWQRRILPVVKEFFPNATIFLTTHSPFVVNSIDGAAIYELQVEAGKAYLGEVTESKSSRSYQNVLREVFDIDEDFGQPIQLDLDLFYQYRNEILAGNESNEDKFIKLANKLAKESIEQESVELQNIIGFELRQVNRIKGENYSV